jgi:hypothetical protein
MSHQPVNCGNSLGLSDDGLAASTARSGCSARVDIRSASWGRVPPLKWEKCDGLWLTLPKPAGLIYLGTSASVQSRRMRREAARLAQSERLLDGEKASSIENGVGLHV